MRAAAAEASYRQLIERSRELSVLSSCSALLGWDEKTYMPPGGVAHRGAQLAMLAGICHERVTDPRLGELLATVEGSSLVADPRSPAAVNVRELRRSYDRRTRIPRALVEETVKTVAFAQQAWVSAYHSADYAAFRPWLEKIIGLRKQQAECLAAGRALYDVLLDEYEPGASSDEIAKLFKSLRQPIVDLLEQVLAGRRNGRPSVLQQDFPVDRQRVFCEAVASHVGFDFQRGRVDTTLHPFMVTVGAGDSRIALRYSSSDLNVGLYSLLHEVGHALYEQGLDPAHTGTPMGESASLGIHESQSRLWENAVGRSRAFWQHFLPLAQEIFHDSLGTATVDDLLGAVCRVERGLNRVQADEVTYNLHVMVRFDIERAFVAGQLAAADLPGAWRELYREYLGVTPRNDREGCLQDSHWSSGLLGYFPTYTLGNVYAAQLFEAARGALGDLDGQLARGEFAPLLGWLRENVHRHGMRHRAAELVERATGAPPSHEPLVASLRSRYRQDH